MRTYSLTDFNFDSLKVIQQSTNRYGSENHSRQVYYDESENIYVKIWDDDYVRRSNLKLAFDFNFFDDLIPHFQGLIIHDNIIRGYVTKEAVKTEKHYGYLLERLIKKTRKYNIFLNDFCLQHCYEFEGKPCLIDLEGVWLVDDYKSLVEHHKKVENPKGNFIVDSNYKKVVEYLYRYVPISLQYFMQCHLHKGGGGKEIPSLNHKLDTVGDVINYWTKEKIDERLPTLKPENWQYFNCMLSEFRQGVEDHHKRKNENMTLEYYQSLPMMTDEEIKMYLEEVPCEFDEYFIKHSVHRAYAMIGRLINDKPYIPFYMDVNKVYHSKSPIDNVNYISSVIGLPVGEFTIVQSGILALMCIRQNDDLDIVISSKFKNTLKERLYGVELMINHNKFKVFGCVDDDDLVYNYSKFVNGVKFAQPRFYFSRKNKLDERALSDWEQIKLFFKHNSHTTYPYRIFSEKEWGSDLVKESVGV